MSASSRSPAPRLLLVLVSFSALLACTSSQVEPDAPVTLRGTVEAPSGVPTGEVDVGLVKLADVGELVFGSTLAIGTLGAVCLTDDAPAVCGDAREADVGADGAYSFQLEGSDTQGSVGQASDFDLTATAPRPDGGEYVTSTRFEIQTEQLELPRLGFWDATLTVSADAATIRAEWPALPASLGESPSYSLRFLDTGADPGALVWNVPTASPGQQVDRRLLEDRRGRVELGATTENDGPDTTFRTTHFAAPSSFEGPGPAPSRGLACAATTDDGQTRPLEPCPLTDGALYEPAGFSAEGTVFSGAYVDLGAPQPVGLVVARGAIGPVTVETSPDARTWQTAGTSSGRLVAVTPPRPVEARYVRVRTSNGTDLSNLAEISIWPRS